MDLWIRNQSDYTEQKLIKAEKINIELVIDNIWIVNVNGIRVAEYTTRKLAVEVLNEIQNLLIDRYVVGEPVLPKNCIIYQMPLNNKEEQND